MLASVSTSTVGSTNQPGPSLRPPPTEHAGAFLAAAVDVAGHPVELHFADQRPDHRLGIERVADAQHLRHPGDAFEHLVGDLLLHEQPAARGADLARR